ncbi:hypothetical protein WUBG_15505 [Wuchereria bancrofti]|uniref:Uncharacterized protein n=1 Tax=Wuchereria bancrofti TaxID=6293 RepID=J9DVC0_WUCBA|nr:hypothetical protein WUBG_15505 [Wuchereria bancrofti]
MQQFKTVDTDTNRTSTKYVSKCGKEKQHFTKIWNLIMATFLSNFYRSYLSVTMCDKEIGDNTVTLKIPKTKKIFLFFLEKNYHWKKFLQTVFELLKKKERQWQAVTMIVRRWATNGTAIPAKISMQLG